MRDRVFGLTRTLPRGSRKRRMTHDQSVQIAVTSAALRRGRPHAATRVSVGRRSKRDVVVPAESPNAVAQNAGSASRPRRNFPACKAMKTHKMRKESRFCASPFHGPAERLAPRRKAQRAGGAALEPNVLDPARASDTRARLTGRDSGRPRSATSGSQIAPQRLEKIDSRLGDCSTSEAANPQDVVRVLTSPLPLLPRDLRDLAHHLQRPLEPILQLLEIVHDHDPHVRPHPRHRTL
jgi:hypothetical protein